jgi:hypothetical protein
MAGELVALRAAPVLDSYSGPVLFSGRAAADLLHQVLAPRLLAHRRPLIGIPQVARMASQIEENRVGRRLLPHAFSVTDDPSLKQHAGLGLIGHCQYDDEGVAARKIKLIEKGKVTALLASRTPMKDVPASTGHGRRSIPGFNQAQITNLLVEAGTKTVPAKGLEKKLLTAAARMDLEYGLLIEQLDDPDITGREFSLQAMMSSAMGGASGTDQVNPPALVYKVFPDGRRELVRGLSFQEFSLRALRDIGAAGDTPAVCHKLAGGGLGKIPIPLFFSMAGGRGPKIPRAPISLVAPALLFEELELNKIEGTGKKPVVLPRP